MATDIVADKLSDPGTDAPDPSLQPRYAPEDHEKAAPSLKIIRLVELGSNAHGKTATFEFTGGFVRSIDLDAETVWHSALKDLKGQELRKILEHVAVRSKGEDGIARVQDGPMWFWTRRETQRGRVLGYCYFDVPEEAYSAGRLTGAKAARELILFLKKYEDSWKVDWSLKRSVGLCLSEAFALAQAPYTSKPTTRNAAVAFCELVTAFFCVGSSVANPAYLDSQVDEGERSVAWEVSRDEQDRLETAERMRALRAAKAAKRAASNGAANASVQQFASNEVVAAGHTLQ